MSRKLNNLPVLLGLSFLLWMPFPSFAETVANQEILINIKVKEVPIDEVVNDIAEQSEYKIVINEKIDDPISIALIDYPLVEAVDRILSLYNYSILHDAEKRTLEVQIVNDKVGSVAGQQQQPGHVGAQMGGADSPMAGVATSLAQYRQGLENGTNTRAPGPSPPGSPMAGVAASLAAYRQSLENGTSRRDPGPSPAGSPMAGVAASLAEYQKGLASGTTRTANGSSPSGSPMAGVASSLAEYRQGLASSTARNAPAPSPKGSPMAGVAESMADYYTQRENR